VPVARGLVPHLHAVHSVSGVLASVQTHSLSGARLIFLVVLVVFFCLLFIASYVWMRRPSFGQGGGRPGSGAAVAKGVERVLTRTS
jgi:hypothetical protein